MEIKLMYGLFASFFVVLLVSAGILYLIFSPNPVVHAWSNMTDMVADTVLATIYDPSAETEKKDTIDQKSSPAQSDQQLIDQSQTADQQVLGSESSNSNNEPVTTQQPSATTQNIESEAIEPAPEFNLDQLYRFINTHREENNLTKLSVNLALERSARTKVIDMIQDDYWRHENTSGEPTWQFLRNAGYPYELAGENLSFGNNSAWQTFEGWLNSADHNAQMLKPEYEDMGAAYDCYTYTNNGQPSCIVVLHLGKQV